MIQAKGIAAFSAKEPILRVKWLRDQGIESLAHAGIAGEHITTFSQLI